MEPSIADVLQLVNALTQRPSGELTTAETLLESLRTILLQAARNEAVLRNIDATLKLR